MQRESIDYLLEQTESKGLCSVLRKGILQVNKAILTQENKGDKIHF